MEKIFALFDFDGTLIGGDSIVLFMRYAWRHKLCSAVDLARFLLAGILYTVQVDHAQARQGNGPPVPARQGTGGVRRGGGGFLPHGAFAADV